MIPRDDRAESTGRHLGRLHSRPATPVRLPGACGPYYPSRLSGSWCSVSVIDFDRASANFHTVIATIGVGGLSAGVAFTPDGTRAYVVAREDGNVAVIDTASHAVVPVRIGVQITPGRVAITADGTRAYVNNLNSRSVSVIDTDPTSATIHTVVAAIPVAGLPSMVVVGPPPRQQN